MRIEVKDLKFSYQDKTVLDGIDFKANVGELISVIGPNGVGKTTFFRCLLGFLKAQSGSISINGKDVNLLSAKDLAKNLAYIPQSYSPAFNHTVLDSVLMGTTNKLGLFESPNELMRQKALSVLKELGISEIAYRGTQKISGGEKQLVLLARALVQDAHILIMDEPTANLDFGNSFKVMSIVRNLCEKGYTILVSTHDPTLAMHFATRIIAMYRGRIISDSKPEELSQEILGKLYSVNVTICPQCKGVVVK